MIRIAEIVTKLEDSGVQINRIEVDEHGELLIDGTPLEKMEEVFRDMGWG